MRREAAGWGGGAGRQSAVEATLGRRRARWQRNCCALLHASWMQQPTTLYKHSQQYYASNQSGPAVRTGIQPHKL